MRRLTAPLRRSCIRHPSGTPVSERVNIRSSAKEATGTRRMITRRGCCRGPNAACGSTSAASTVVRQTASTGTRRAVGLGGGKKKKPTNVPQPSDTVSTPTAGGVCRGDIPGLRGCACTRGRSASRLHTHFMLLRCQHPSPWCREEAHCVLSVWPPACSFTGEQRQKALQPTQRAAQYPDRCHPKPDPDGAFSPAGGGDTTCSTPCDASLRGASRIPGAGTANSLPRAVRLSAPVPRSAACRVGATAALASEGSSRCDDGAPAERWVQGDTHSR